MSSTEHMKNVKSPTFVVGEKIGLLFDMKLGLYMFEHEYNLFKYGIIKINHVYYLLINYQTLIRRILLDL